MAGTANDMLQTISTLMQLQGMQQQQKIQRQQATVQGPMQFVGLGRQVTSDEQPGLVQTFADLGYGTPETLQRLLDTTTMNTDVRAGAREDEMERSLTPSERTELFRAGAFRNITGMSEAQLKADRAISSMDPDYFIRRARIEGGLELSAGQQQQGEQFNRSLAQDASQFGQTIGLQRQQFNEGVQQFGEEMTFRWTDLAQRSGLAEQELSARVSQLQSKGVDAEAMLDDYETSLKGLQDLVQSKKDVPPAMLQARLNALNIQIVRLKQTNPPVLPPSTPLLTLKDIENPGFFGRLFR